MKETLKKAKAWVKTKTARACMALSVAATALAGTALAEGEAGATTSNSEQVITAMSSGFSSVASDLGSVILAIVPIALGIVGLTILIKRGMAWFKSMSKG